MSYIPYKKSLKELARQLRKNSTIGEILLWKRLSGRKFCGLQFNRQKPIGKYLVDFYCKSINLVIEIHGYSHGFEKAHQKDRSKQKDLKAIGLTVLHFSEGEVQNNIDSVLRAIEAFIQTKNPPSPLFRGEQPFPRHIYLCGFMGSGKTTVGKLLAEKLSYAFMDTDHVIEQNEKKAIRDIFENSGEAPFRKLENRVIEQAITSKQNTVIALGGGSLLRKENIHLIKKEGYLVYLNTDLNTISGRLQTDTARPLLKRATVEALLDQRKPGYEAADLIIKTQDHSPAEVAEAILRRLSRHNKK